MENGIVAKNSIWLLIIADDFTGALDAAVQFTSSGMKTRVTTDLNLEDQDFTDVQVLSVDAETRHLPSVKAYKIVYDIVKFGKKRGIRCICKKTDSGLRGNIGYELTAALDASGQDVLHFIPAFPQMNRITENGIQYVDGVPVSQSVFGKDPFDPVVMDSVQQIINSQVSETPVSVVTDRKMCTEKGIAVYDAKTREDILNILFQLAKSSNTILMAGCAGLNSVLASFIHLLNASEPGNGSVLVVCGSINPVSLEQMKMAEKAGAPRFSLSNKQKFRFRPEESKKANYLIQDILNVCKENSMVLIDSGKVDLSFNGKNRVSVMFAMGEMIKRLLDGDLESTIFIIGGDTLFGFMHKAGVKCLTPICELATGVVLSSYEYNGKKLKIITKSGGFGDPDLLCNLHQLLGIV